jgi:hypothetical protein
MAIFVFVIIIRHRIKRLLQSENNYESIPVRPKIRETNTKLEAAIDNNKRNNNNKNNNDSPTRKFVMKKLPPYTPKFEQTRKEYKKNSSDDTYI